MASSYSTYPPSPGPSQYTSMHGINPFRYQYPTTSTTSQPAISTSQHFHGRSSVILQALHLGILFERPWEGNTMGLALETERTASLTNFLSWSFKVLQSILFPSCFFHHTLFICITRTKSNGNGSLEFSPRTWKKHI